jgi:hypothetical protein
MDADIVTECDTSLTENFRLAERPSRSKRELVRDIERRAIVHLRRFKGGARVPYPDADPQGSPEAARDALNGPKSALKEILLATIAETAQMREEKRKTSGKAPNAETWSEAINEVVNNSSRQAELGELIEKFIELSVPAGLNALSTETIYVVIFDLFLTIFAAELDASLKKFAKEIQSIFLDSRISKSERKALSSIAAEALTSVDELS